MPFGFLQRGGTLSEHAQQTQLSSYQPSIQLENLVRGVDNIRHDVALSARFMESTRNHIFRLITRHGQIEALVDDAPTGARPLTRVRLPAASAPEKVFDAISFRRALLELHLSILNRA